MNPIAAAPSCNEMALHGQLAAAKQKHVACYYKIEAKGAGKRGGWGGRGGRGAGACGWGGWVGACSGFFAGWGVGGWVGIAGFLGFLIRWVKN